MFDTNLAIRATTPSDSDTLARLAGLDSRPQLRGPALLAEHHGVAIAAISVSTGSIVTDPARASAEVLHRLRRRRYRIVRQGSNVGQRAMVLRRLAPPFRLAV